MEAIKKLCTRGIVLNDGQLFFDGAVEMAVDAYARCCNTHSNTKIVDGITSRNACVAVDTIRFNGTDSCESIISGSQETIELCIQGKTSAPIDVAVKLIFKTVSGTPIMCYAEGRCTGILERVEGNFSYVRNICLPQYLAKGDYMIDICMHKPSVLDYFYAKDCAIVHVQQSNRIHGLPLKLRTEGAFSMISK